MPPLVTQLRELVGLNNETLREAEDFDHLAHEPGEKGEWPNVYFDKKRSILCRRFYEDRQETISQLFKSTPQNVCGNGPIGSNVKFKQYLGTGSHKENITKYQLEIQLVSFDAEVKNSHLMSGENN